MPSQMLQRCVLFQLTLFTMNNFIDDFIDQNEKVTTFLEQVAQDCENADKNFATFKDYLIDTKYNTALGICLANFLQCLGEKDNCADLELIDISRLFDSLIKTQEFNIDTYVEAGHFEWAVMDNKHKAIEIINNGLTKANAKMQDLKKLLYSIQEEAGA
jgi:hypothetical protein